MKIKKWMKSLFTRYNHHHSSELKIDARRAKFEKCSSCRFTVRLNLHRLRILGGCCPVMANQKNGKECSFKPKYFSKGAAK